MADGDIYQFTAVQELGTRALANVFFQKTITEGSLQDEESGAHLAFRANLLTTLTQVQSTDLVYECTLSRKVFPITSPTRVFAETLTGAQPSSALPSNQVATMSCIAKPGLPWDYGRFFISGLPETWVSRGRISASDANEFDSLGQVILNSYTNLGGEYQLQHWSPKSELFKDFARCNVRPVMTKHRNRTRRLCGIS